MSNYNSTNTLVLETYEMGKNTRMLLLHVCESGRLEYVIGSYFTETPYARVSFGEVPKTENLVEYSWDWGHYFSDAVSAVDYWKREVLEEE